MIDPVLEIGPHVTALPVVYGNGDFAWEVRRLMQEHQFDCVAVPLPRSFQDPVEDAILQLPVPGIVIQHDLPGGSMAKDWKPAETESDSRGDFDELESNNDDDNPGVSFVPIDPCQSVIAALRVAIGERIPRRFVDLETSQYRPATRVYPDGYALKKVSIQQYAAAVLPSLSAPRGNAQWQQRIRFMASRLRELSVDFNKILFVTSVLDWPWVRQAFLDPDLKRPEEQPSNDPARHEVKPETLYFLLGELPFITDLYETARSELGDDANLSIDGVKELLLSSRDSYQAEYKNRARRITPKILVQCLKYIRNLTLIEHGITPQLATIITGAQQVAGDGYALSVLEKAKEYSHLRDLELPEVRMGIDRIGFADGDNLKSANRLPGPPVIWTQLELIPKPDHDRQKEWKQKWNPHSQCSWPPEDELIENFRRAVFDRAREVMGEDLAKTEKFTTSVKDGIDIRDTVRHWYDKEIYVKVLPPARGRLDCAVMLFDSPADPRNYPWRTTWFAEHENESTLAFFATNFSDQPVGPGICLANYGGALFRFPPIAIPDIWHDPRLNFTTTLEERLLAAACLHSDCPHVALVSPGVPGPAWKYLARRFKKTWIHLPLSRFSDETVQQLRMVHVLNGKQVRSYAADFIRRS